MLNKMAISNFDRVTLGKMSVGGGLVVLQFFGHLKGALELLMSFQMNPLAIFWKHLVDTITSGKKNRHASVIFLPIKIQNSGFLQIGA